jgi:hypothetical protein
MGMDLDIRSDKEDQIKTDEYLDRFFNEHSLSRTFCNILDEEDVDGESELRQVGKITGADISPIFQMANYINEDLEFNLDGTESKEERQRILYSNSSPKGNLNGNIDRVLRSLSELIEKTRSINNLAVLLEARKDGRLDIQSYFADFNIDKGDGYIGNNFGQDLRNFKKAVEFMKAQGAITVYFGFD